MGAKIWIAWSGTGYCGSVACVEDSCPALVRLEGPRHALVEIRPGGIEQGGPASRHFPRRFVVSDGLFACAFEFPNARCRVCVPEHVLCCIGLFFGVV